MLNPNASRGVGGSPAAETKSRYKYGTYWTRVKTANCSAQPKAGVVTGIFTYFNDGADRNGNGLPDNNEIDFEWLGAKSEVVYLTIWTDY
jgi:beta-glucanase (GH16 family)